MWKRSVFYFFLYYLVRSASSACYDSTVCLQKPYLSCCERENSIRDQCGINGVSSHSRIYGGRPASEGDLPWMAVLYYTRRRDPQCGASVINRWFLVTAAHCLTGEAINKHLGEPSHTRLGVNKLSVASNPRDVYGFSQVIPHPEFDDRDGNRRADIGLLKLDRMIAFHETVQPVCLPAVESPIGSVLIVAGWGKTPSAYFNDQKLKTTLKVLQPGVCERAYEKSNLHLGADQLCTGGSGNSDTCRGDSGNGLYEVQNSIYYLQGIVSFGAASCGNEHLPSISTKVRFFINWIRKYTST